MQDGELVAGVVYDPFAMTLRRGKGHRRMAQGRRAACFGTCTLQESFWPPAFPATSAMPIPTFTFISSSRLRSHGVRRAGSAALDLAYCAAGRMDGFWEFNLNPWDTAAGALLVTEAGAPCRASTARLSSR